MSRYTLILTLLLFVATPLIVLHAASDQPIRPVLLAFSSALQQHTTTHPPLDAQIPRASESSVSLLVLNRTRPRPSRFVVRFHLPFCKARATPPLVVIKSAFLEPSYTATHDRVVFLLELEKNVLRNSAWSPKLVGCVSPMDGHGDSELFRNCTLTGFIQNGWTNGAFPHLTHEFAQLSCLVRSSASLRRGDVLALVFERHTVSSNNKDNTNNSNNGHATANERLCVFPSPARLLVSANSTRRGWLCSVIAVLRSTPSFLPEWLEWQKYIGSEHVFAYAVDGWQDESGVLNRAVSDGYATVIRWPRHLNSSNVYGHSQHLAFNDFFFRFRSLYTWAIVSDSDDFFWAPSFNHSLAALLRTVHSPQPNYPACVMFDWIDFYPDCGVLKHPANTTTTIVSTPTAATATTSKTTTVLTEARTPASSALPSFALPAYVPVRADTPLQRKTAHRCSVANDVGVHECFASREWIARAAAFYAHIRRNREPEGGCPKL